MGNIRQLIFTFFKAQSSAGIATAVDFFITTLLLQVHPLGYFIPTLTGALCGGITNCCINYQWVFHGKGMKKRWVALRYLMVWGMSIAMNTGGTMLMNHLCPGFFLILKACVACVVAVAWNFPMQRSFVFRKSKSNIIIK